jgi:hypothetical protein
VAQGQPPAATAGVDAAWQHKIADGMHYLLYFLIFAVPISGYFYTYAAGVPVVYLGLWQMPAVIGADPELKAFKNCSLCFDHDDGRSSSRPRPGRFEAPLYRSRRHAETHAAAVTNNLLEPNT